MNAQVWHQPAAYQCADDADGNVTDNSKSATGDNFSSKPASHQADQQNDKKTLPGDVHCAASLLRNSLAPDNAEGTNWFQGFARGVHRPAITALPVPCFRTYRAVPLSPSTLRTGIVAVHVTNPLTTSGWFRHETRPLTVALSQTSGQ